MPISKRKEGSRTVYQATDRTRGFSSYSKTFSSKAEAKEWLARVKSERQRGEEYDPQRLAKMTLGEALQWYLQTVTPNKGGRIQEEKRGRQLLRLPLMQLGIGTVMPHDFAAYVEKRTKAGKTGSTIRKELSLLSQVYVKARRVLRLYSLENPLKDVEKPPCALPRDRRLDEKTDEEGRLIKYFRERKRGNVEMPYLLVAAIETGLRKSELLRLLWRDIRWGDAPWITVEQARKGRVVRKDKEFRGLPLTSRAVTNFKELRAVQLDRVAGPLPADAPVFTLTVATIDNARAKALKATGITDWRLHDARHEAASRFYVRGLKQEFIRRMLGHRSLKMTEGYQDFLQEEMSEAMKQAEAVVASEEGSPGGESK